MGLAYVLLARRALDMSFAVTLARRLRIHDVPPGPFMRTELSAPGGREPVLRLRKHLAYVALFGVFGLLAGWVFLFKQSPAYIQLLEPLLKTLAPGKADVYQTSIVAKDPKHSPRLAIYNAVQEVTFGIVNSVLVRADVAILHHVA
jgi:hypothetical protein